MAQRRIPTKNKITLTVTFERTWWWAGIFLSDSDCPHHRTKARRQSCQRLYSEALSRPESWQRESHLFPLHMCYRHREYPLCVCCCERHNSTTKPEGIQPGVKAAGHPSPGPENQIRFICKRSDITQLSPPGGANSILQPRGWVMELARCLNSAKRFQSLAFTFLFLTLSCKIFCIIFEFGILQNSKKPLWFMFFFFNWRVYAIRKIT